MSDDPQGPYVWLRKERKRKDGYIEKPVYIIIDGGKQAKSTGCGPAQRAQADVRLAEYILEKHRPAPRERDIAAIPIADVINIYDADKAETQSSPGKLAKRLERLLTFAGTRTLAEVTPEFCRDYIATREGKTGGKADVKGGRAGTGGGARRDLEDLRAAINHHARRGLHRELVFVTLPEKGLPREKWLTRQEAARLLWVCWRTREVQTVHRGTRKGSKVESDFFPLRHLARFLLLGLYTGSRAAAIARASWAAASDRSYIDLAQGLFYRRPPGMRETKKRQPPVRLPTRLLAHLRRWKDTGASATYVVEWHGLPVRSVKTALNRAVSLAGIEGRVTPHTLRHTATTWMMQEGVDTWEAAGFLGMSEQMIRDVYGHHHPDYQRNAAEALGTGRKRRASPKSPPIKTRNQTATSSGGDR
jgi:integrase